MSATMQAAALGSTGLHLRTVAFAVVFLFSQLLSVSAQQQGGSCSAGLRGTCNTCVCCCYKSAIPAYKPVGCDCKPDWGKPFILMVITAAATLAISILTSCYFSGRNVRFSPYHKPAAVPRQDIPLAAL